MGSGSSKKLKKVRREAWRLEAENQRREVALQREIQNQRTEITQRVQGGRYVLDVKSNAPDFIQLAQNYENQEGPDLQPFLPIEY